MRDGPRRVLVTLGTGLVLLAAGAAGSVPDALASPQVTNDSALIPTPNGEGLPQRTATAGSDLAGPLGPARSQPGAPVVSVGELSHSVPKIAPLHGLLQADLLVVATSTLRDGIAAAVAKMHGVVAVQQVDAARIEVDGKFIAMIGVDPSAFRAFSAKPTAQSTRLWQNVADGGIATSYEMGKLDKLPLGRPVRVVGRQVEQLPVAGFGTVGIPGIDAAVSDTVARSLGMPEGNAIVISAPHVKLNPLIKQVKKVLPKGAAIAPLVAQTITSTAAPSTGAAGAPSTSTAGLSGITGSSNGLGLTRNQMIRFLTAAESRLGLPYVWGGDGPLDFDCSGLVQWSFAQAGVIMPRVAADQARTGPEVPISQLQPGDLLFYHTDPTAPTYISHVAIYLGAGEMIQAPQPGMDVEIVPASFGSEFAGAVAVYPRIAAAVAANVAG